MWRFSSKAVVLLLFCCVFGSELFSGCLALDADEVTKVLQTSFDCHKSQPAMAVALVKDGKTLYSRGFGHTTTDKTTNVTDETLFGIASVSKSFAAALFVKLLYEKTELTIDSKVRDLLGDAFVLDDEFRAREATFLDLLSHKLAILSDNRIRLDTTLTRDTLLSRLGLLKSNRQFRVDFVYNNLIYGLIGRMSEIIGGHAKNNKRWEDLITEHFFEPLGMSKSTFSTRLNYSREDLATGYDELDGPGVMTRVMPELSIRWGDLCASGAIVSSVKDMTNWLNFHLTGGKDKAGKTVMDEKLVEELHEPRFQFRSPRYVGIEKPKFPITVMETAYAMGLKIGHYRGYPLIAHTGSTYGYRSYMALLPTEKIGVVFLSTGKDSYTRQRAAVAHYLIDTALGVEPYMNSTTICTYPKPWDTRKLSESFTPKRSSEALRFKKEEYLGTYTEKAYGNLKITYNSTLDSLMMEYGWGFWELLVWPDKDSEEQRFFGKDYGEHNVANQKPVYFIEHPEKKGTVVGFRASSFESKRPPIFCKKEHEDVCGEIRKKAYPKDVELCPPGKDSNSARSTILEKWKIFAVPLMACLIFYLQ